MSSQRGFSRFGVAAVIVNAAVLAGGIVPPAAAQTTGLTLQRAFEQALQRNPTIAAARLRSPIDAAAVAVARERPNPEASVEIEKETPKQSFGVALPLEVGGKRQARIAASEAAARTGEAELAVVIMQVRDRVRRAYSQQLIAESRLALLNELRDLSSRIRDAASARFDNGDAPRLEVSQANLALAAAQNEATAEEGAVAAARATLSALLGVPVSKEPLAPEVDMSSPVAGDAAIALATRSNGELAVLGRRLDEQRARLALARAMRTPDVTPAATLTHDSEPEFVYGWRAAVTVTLPVFTTHKAAVTLEEATLAQLTAERDAQVARITGEVAAAAAVAEAQRLSYVRYRDVILPQAQEVEQLAQDSYQLGQTGIVALLQALQTTRDLRLRSLDSLAQLHTALAELERAVGAPLP